MTVCSCTMNNLQFDIDKIARYDDYKKEFYAMCTLDFTKDWIEKIKTLQQWIKQML